MTLSYQEHKTRLLLERRSDSQSTMKFLDKNDHLNKKYTPNKYNFVSYDYVFQSTEAPRLFSITTSEDSKYQLLVIFLWYYFQSIMCLLFYKIHRATEKILPPCLLLMATLHILCKTIYCSFIGSFLSSPLSPTQTAVLLSVYLPNFLLFKILLKYFFSKNTVLAQAFLPPKPFLGSYQSIQTVASVSTAGSHYCPVISNKELKFLSVILIVFLDKLVFHYLYKFRLKCSWLYKIISKYFLHKWLFMKKHNVSKYFLKNTENLNWVKIYIYFFLIIWEVQC